jgi:hypothetical protein
MRRFILPLAVVLGLGAFAGAAHADPDHDHDYRRDGYGYGDYRPAPPAPPVVVTPPPVYAPRPVFARPVRERGYWVRRHHRWVWVLAWDGGWNRPYRF